MNDSLFTCTDNKDIHKTSLFSYTLHINSNIYFFIKTLNSLLDMYIRQLKTVYLFPFIDVKSF